MHVLSEVGRTIAPLFKHQQEDVEFCSNKPYVYNASDPGTGKTRTCIELIRRLKLPTLIFAPKSILKCSWDADIKKFAPELTTSIAFAENRASAFKVKADVYITNIDALTWVAKQPKILKQFEGGILIIDEATAIKNPTAQRSKAARTVAECFSRRILMSGTPAPNTIVDLHNQYLVLDRGERLGSSWYAFRQACCTPVQTGAGANMVKWVDKPMVGEVVGELISDITIRRELESVIDMPETVVTNLVVDMSSRVMEAYEVLRQDSMLMIEQQTVTAVNAAVLVQKLLQCLSGVIYDEHGDPVVIDDTRSELVLDLVEQRQHSLVAFMWRSQRDQLILAAKARKLSHAVLDGETSSKQRAEIVERYQRGEYRVVFAQPQSTAHGITLTKGTTTIWASPTYSSELYTQFCHRIYRAGQTQRTETIHIAASATQEERVYAALRNKLDAQDSLLTTLLGK